MKKKVLIIIMLLTLNIGVLNATTGSLKNATIVECNGVFYGAHGSDNHYHVAELNEKGNYVAKGESLGSDWTCDGEVININENKELERVKAEFSSCVDGDTAVFKINGKEEKFRFLAIDTPETVHPTKGVEAFGKNASEYTCNKLQNAKEIYIEYEDSKVDKYGRSLGWIWIDGSLLQEELVSIGYAEVAYIYGNYKYTNLLCDTQEKAIISSFGIWSEDRKEGYCSTLRTVDKNNAIERDKNETTDEEIEEKENYTKETIGAAFLILLGILIKALKK